MGVGTESEYRIWYTANPDVYPGQFGTGSEVSMQQFGASAEVSMRRFGTSAELSAVRPLCSVLMCDLQVR